MKGDHAGGVVSADECTSVGRETAGNLAERVGTQFASVFYGMNGDAGHAHHGKPFAVGMEDDLAGAAALDAVHFALCGEIPEDGLDAEADDEHLRVVGRE